MAIRPEQLEAYWAANPGALQQAVQSNPSAFAQPSGMMADVNVGIPNLGQRAAQPTQAQPAFSGFDLSSLNAAFAQQNSPEAIEQALRDRGTGFDLGSWLAADPSRTPQQAYQQGLLSVGTASPSGSFGTGLGELGPIASGVRQEYATGLDQMLADAGRSRVEEVDGQLYALFTGQDDRFSGISTLPRGYEWAEGDRVPGQYYRVQIPEPHFFEEYIDPDVRNAVAIGGALTGNPFLAAGTAGASTAFQGGDIEDIAKNALTSGALVGLGNYLAPTPATSTVGADGLSNVVTNTASGAAAQTAPNLAQQASGFFDKATGLLRSQNPAGSFTRGSLTSAVGQAIINGEISLEDAVRAGLIQTGVDTVVDVFGDTRQTNTGNLIEGVDTTNGVPMTAEDVARLTDTSDVYTILGPEGILSKVTGLDVPYLPTDWAGNALDFVDNVVGTNLGGRPIVDPGGRFEQEYRDTVNTQVEGTLAENQKNIELYQSGQISYNDLLQRNSDNLAFSRESLQLAENNFLRNTARYDERFFDVFTPRGTSPLTGIWENNPVAARGPVVTSPAGSGSGSGGGTAPDGTSVGGLPAATGGGVFIDVGPDEDVEPAEGVEEQEEAEFTEEEIEAIEDTLASGRTGPELTDVSEDPLAGAVDAEDIDELPPSVDSPVDLPGGVDEVPASGGLPVLDGLPSGASLPSGVADGIVSSLVRRVLPPGGARGGARGLPPGPGDADFESFMSGITYVIPVLQKLNIPLTDYIAMWIKENRA